MFEEARDAVERSRLLRLVHAPDDQSMLIQSMAKVTRFVNLLQVRSFLDYCYRLMLKPSFLQLEISGQTEIVVKGMHQDVKYKGWLPYFVPFIRNLICVQIMRIS